ncbi:MAG: copper resistance protein CopC [Actinomycetota bacterium]|nr:copper resistance protein CopC [Actinomycetota bacterium]
MDEDGEPIVIIARTRQRPSGVALGIVVAAFSLLVAAGPAAAHTDLVSSDPADGAVLATAPPAVSFTFSESLLPDTATISVNDAGGNVIASSPVEPDGATVSAPWPAEAAAGTFQVAYRVVAEDGHPLTGAITIAIDAVASAPASSAASPSPAASATQGPVGEPAEPARGVAGALVVTVLIAVVVLAIVAAAVTWRRRSS